MIGKSATPLSLSAHSTSAAATDLPLTQTQHRFTYPLRNIILAVAAGLLVFWQLVPAHIHSPLEIDEQITYYLSAGVESNTTSKNPANSVWERCLQQSATPPVYFWLSAASLNCFGTTTWALRLPSLLAFLTILSLGYFLCEKMLGRGTGGGFLLLLAVQPELLAAGLTARPYLLGTFWLTAALVTYWQWRTNRSIVFPVLWLVCLLGLVWTHFLYTTAVAGLCLVALLWPGAAKSSTYRIRLAQRRLSVLILGIFAGLSLLLFLPQLERLYHYRQILNWTTQVTPRYQPLQILIPWQKMLFWHGAQLDSYFILRSFSLIVLLGLIGSSWWRQRLTQPAELPPFKVGLILLVLTLVPTYILWGLSLGGNAALIQPRYLVPMYVPATLWQWWIICRLLPNMPQRWLALFLWLMLIDAGPAVWQRLSQPIHHDPYWKEVAEQLTAKVQPHDCIFLYTGLVESALLPVADHAQDADFQAYVGSRLSSFYFHAPTPRYILPPDYWFTPTPAPWLQHYQSLVTDCQQRGGTIWLVCSADSDRGQQSQTAALHWLASLGYTAIPFPSHPVATVHRLTPSPLETTP